MAKRIDAVMDCPGGWYGWNPDERYGYQGHVVVDPAKLRDAMQWLGKRYVVGESATLTSDGGILITITKRGITVHA